MLFSAAGLVVLAPLLALIALIVRSWDGGPVFFVEDRIGKNFRPFRRYKFRTTAPCAPGMGLDAAAGCGVTCVTGATMLTGAGRVLRRAGLDGLPQLWNVLKGEMSIVGPGPEAEKYVNEYKQDFGEILKVRPGIIDMVPVVMDGGPVLKHMEDPEKHYIHIVLPEKLRLAREYVRTASPGGDLRLIFLAIARMAYPAGRVADLIMALGRIRKPVVLLVHVFEFALSNYLAFLISFGGAPGSGWGMFLMGLPFIVLVRTIFLYVFSLDRGLWRYLSEKDVMNIMGATTSGSIVFFLIARFALPLVAAPLVAAPLVAAPLVAAPLVAAPLVAYPLPVYVIDWSMNVIFLTGVRFFRRLHERGAAGKRPAHKRVVIVGAGNAAEMLIRDMEQSPYYSYEIAGLIDDDKLKKGLKIRDVPILGTRKDIPGIISRKAPDEFLVAIPSAGRSELESILEDLRKYGLPIRSLPGFWGMLTGREASALKPVSAEDILFRASTFLGWDESARSFFEGSRVLVTGAGGSIGSELARQIARFRPESLVLFERHEEGLYKIDMELRALYGDMVASVIGDVTDPARVAGSMRSHRPGIIFHAAAYKHVPLMEANPGQAFTNNVIGTKVLAENAIRFGVERFIQISTDKAVNPVSVMGMTKKVAEMVGTYYAGLDIGSKPKYIITRFGNVLESSGSVVPLFRRQIRDGGPVTVTHPEVTRYFMTINEAVSLVLHAASMGRGGGVFVLDMGEPIKILDLAKRMICLYGFRPGTDIDISFTGLRPGEKLYEELFNSEESVELTAHPKIHRAVGPACRDNGFLRAIDSGVLPGTAEDLKRLLECVLTQPQPL